MFLGDMLSRLVGTVRRTLPGTAGACAVDTSDRDIRTTSAGSRTKRRATDPTKEVARSVPRWGVEMKTTRLTEGKGLKK